MSSSTNVVLQGALEMPPALRVVAQDIASGVVSTARFIVTLAGCTTLVAAAFVIGDSRVRDAAQQQFDAIAATLITQEAAEADPATAAGTMAQAGKPAKAHAEPAQRYVVQYLARRYKVADGALRPVVAAAYESGRELGLDPLLILAVTAIESSMNPFAESVVGAQGLMQVMTRVHADRFVPHGGEDAALDPITNIKVGSAILSELIRRGGSVERGLQLYVGAGNMADDGGYGAKVLAEHNRLRIAAKGKVDLAVRAAYAGDGKPAPQATPVANNPAPSRPSGDKSAKHAV